MQSIINGRQEVTVTDIKMPFWSMVVFMLKWTIAAIPAMFILTAAGAGLFVLFSVFLATLGHNLNSLAR